MNENELYVVTTLEELTTKYNTNFSYYCLFNLLCLKKQSNTFAAELQANKTCFNTFDTVNLLDDAAKMARQLIVDRRTLIKQLGLFENMQHEDKTSDTFIAIPLPIIQEVINTLINNGVKVVLWNIMLRLFAYFWLATWSGTKQQEVSIRVICDIFHMGTNLTYTTVNTLMTLDLIKRCGKMHFNSFCRPFSYEIAERLTTLKVNNNIFDGNLE